MSDRVLCAGVAPGREPSAPDAPSNARASAVLGLVGGRPGIHVAKSGVFVNQPINPMAPTSAPARQSAGAARRVQARAPDGPVFASKLVMRSAGVTMTTVS